MRQTLNTWMTETAKEVLRGDWEGERFRNDESCGFLFSVGITSFSPQVSQVGFWGVLRNSKPRVCQPIFFRWLCFSSAGQYIYIYIYMIYIYIYICSFKGDLEKKDGRFGGFEA